jgi:DNA modification methylase
LPHHPTLGTPRVRATSLFTLDDLVIPEPFSGSGSQIIAGETTGRRVFAIEISPQYVDVAVKRWQTATGNQAILDSDGRTFEAIAGERLAHAA